MTDDQFATLLQRMDRLESAVYTLLEAIAQEDDDGSTRYDLDGSPNGASREPDQSLG